MDTNKQGMGRLYLAYSSAAPAAAKRNSPISTPAQGSPLLRLLGPMRPDEHAAVMREIKRATLDAARLVKAVREKREAANLASIDPRAH